MLHLFCSPSGSLKQFDIQQSLNEESSSKIQNEQIEGSTFSKLTTVCSLHKENEVFKDYASLPASVLPLKDQLLYLLKLRCIANCISLLLWKYFVMSPVHLVTELKLCFLYLNGELFCVFRWRSC